jgi:hypothetical protein
LPEIHAQAAGGLFAGEDFGFEQGENLAFERGVTPQPLEAGQEGRELVATLGGRRIFSMGTIWRPGWLGKAWRIG